MTTVGPGSRLAYHETRRRPELEYPCLSCGEWVEVYDDGDSPYCRVKCRCDVGYRDSEAVEADARRIRGVS